MAEQRTSEAAAAVRRLHVQILEVQTRTAEEGREVGEEERKADDLPRLLGDHGLGAWARSEQLLRQCRRGHLDEMRQVLELRQLPDQGDERGGVFGTGRAQGVTEIFVHAAIVRRLPQVMAAGAETADMLSTADRTTHHTPLAQVRHRVLAGQPLPFNVYRADTTLLLARGQVVQTAEQIETLLERGSLVDLHELRAQAPQDIAQAPREALPGLWRDSMARVGEVLLKPQAEGFRGALDEASTPLESLIRRDPDLAIFQVLRQEGNAQVQYGLRHSVHAAIVARLIASRLGWPEADMQRAFKTALTMNVAMLALQGQLAEQLAPPTAAQRQQIHEHPQRGRELLELAGIGDALWLQAVEQHHEERDGSGYPRGLADPSELATLVHRADVYTAKLSRRATREAESADRAGRDIFMQDPGHPVCAALVKEFGVYPPGCFVTLASGETGVVVKRGPTVMTPIVAALTNRNGAPLGEPIRRDTMMPLYAIVGVLPPRQMRAKLTPEKLVLLAG